MNVSFYLHLKAAKIDISDHPIVDTILQIREELQKLQVIEEQVEDDLLELVDGTYEDVQAPIIDEDVKQNTAVLKDFEEYLAAKNRKRKRETNESYLGVEKALDDAFNSDNLQPVKRKRIDDGEVPIYENDDDDEENAGKRALDVKHVKKLKKRHRKKKKFKNSRQKLREQYRKGLIKHRSRVPEVRQYSNKGERTGINRRVVHARQLV